MTMVIDTHCHAGLQKYEPVEALLEQMFRNRVAGAVLVQHFGEFDNRYLVDCAERHPGRFAVVGLVDVARDDAPHRLQQLAAQPHVRGVRLRATDRSPAPHPWAIWERADELGLSVSLFGHAADYASDATCEIATRFRNLKLVIEHLGRPKVQGGLPDRDFDRTLKLALLPHVSIKISGFHIFGNEHAFRYPECKPFIRAGIDAFGPERCMWGSNHPRVSSAEGFHNALAHARDHWPWKDARERTLVLGATAARHYGLDDLPAG